MAGVGVGFLLKNASRSVKVSVIVLPFITPQINAASRPKHGAKAAPLLAVEVEGLIKSLKGVRQVCGWLTPETVGLPTATPTCTKPPLRSARIGHLTETMGGDGVESQLKNANKSARASVIVPAFTTHPIGAASQPEPIFRAPPLPVVMVEEPII
jgi:hypothetical protein